LLVLIWYLNREEVVYKFTDPSAFEAVPENFDALDEFLLSQKPDPLDRHNITLMMGLERFTKDNLRRVMQKNWNTTLFPLYGGSILRPLRRKIRIEGAEESADVIRIEEIPHPISNSFEMYNHAADDAAEGTRPW